MSVFIRRYLPVVILLLFVGLSAGLLLNRPQPQQKIVETMVPVLEVVQVKKQQLAFNVNAYGMVKPKHQAELVTQVSGIVNRLAPAFAVGQFVQKDDVLAYLDDDDYHADLAQAQATLAQAKALLEQEIARGIVAKKTLRHVATTKQSALGLRIPQRKQQQANVNFAKAALARAQRNVDRTIITAPFDGLITEKHINVGSHVNIGEQLGHIYGTDIARIRLPVTPRSFSFIDQNPLNTTVVLSNERHANERHGQALQHWTARFIGTEGIIDPQTRMVYLIVDVIDPYQLRLSEQQRTDVLNFGTFVTAKIAAKPIANAIKLQRHMVRDNHVVLVDANGVTQMRKVVIARMDLEHAYIRAGLDEGELVSLTWPDNHLEGTVVTTVLTSPKLIGPPVLTVIHSKVADSGE
ncbi:efflux RND transporter periplasmic adaptor subunit [Photobacterium phosphoreum]|uniref:efflux RND transporter periplasmic adaptor subunit n=1 Tax=Photobacterium phosphoreum TaxID=659 RepID=UPI000D16C2D5|nr:efflux RND transporter periplasmic adaptor subunit [Photobacterium phosphoreum]PSU72870.1 efflux RND transporter periplasmic adaptor subunit [Photobacterium phosphoreum]PSW35733.1 efflux RND transporter periplasmic adaptor subunit [Photobacterium phosphoreum]